MLDPADCGPAFIGLPQDVQEHACDYPEAFFDKTVHEIPRPRPDKSRLEMAIWNAALDGYQKITNDPVPTYAQVVGVVNGKAGPRDYMITAAGGLPGECM